MSSTYVSAELRRLVISRATNLCEYCLIHEDDTYFGCQIDHIISEKHGGLTESENLAYACSYCNRFKGSDIGSVFWKTGEFVRFFNPRIDNWRDHFKLEQHNILPLTDIGEVTNRILRLNDIDRLLERRELWLFGRYPSPEAIAVIS